MANKIPKLNQNNKIIGETTIPEAVTNHWPRRIIRVFIFDGAGAILLQRRSETIINYPGLWDQAVGGHVDVGETEHQAAVRELYEELGIKQNELEEVVAGVKNMACFDTIYKLTLPQTTQINFDPDEVAETQWFLVDEFETAIAESPDRFVPPFVNAWNKFKLQLLE